MVTTAPPPGLAPLPGTAVTLAGGEAYLARAGPRTLLVVSAGVAGFEGCCVTAGSTELRLVERTPAAARRLGQLVPWLAPTPLGTARSFGFGDRLGCATPGHVRALRRAGAGTAPVLAQQSARELRRSGRTHGEVLAAAVWGVLQAGWRGGFGADADHLTTTQEVRDGAAAGCTMFTLDPGAHVVEGADLLNGPELAASLERLPWSGLDDTPEASRRRHVGRPLPTRWRTIALDDRRWARASVRYLRALAALATLAAAVPRGADLEVSFDETASPTTAEEHLYLARELRRLDVPVTSFAPRLPGRWEKAVDHRGDLEDLTAAVRLHAAIAAAHGGYKLAVHSGSDKHRAYEALATAAGGALHLKTAGTSYLEALRLVARRDPALFRAVAELAHARYPEDRATYAISATGDPRRIRATADGGLPGLLDDPDVRQVLHVTFGSVLTDEVLGVRLRRAVDEAGDEYWDLLDRHFTRHLAPLGRA